jgi:hypothetical protein
VLPLAIRTAALAVAFIMFIIALAELGPQKIATALRGIIDRG